MATGSDLVIAALSDASTALSNPGMVIPPMTIPEAVYSTAIVPRGQTTFAPMVSYGEAEVLADSFKVNNPQFSDRAIQLVTVGHLIGIPRLRFETAVRESLGTTLANEVAASVRAKLDQLDHLMITNPNAGVDFGGAFYSTTADPYETGNVVNNLISGSGTEIEEIQEDALDAIARLRTFKGPGNVVANGGINRFIILYGADLVNAEYAFNSAFTGSEAGGSLDNTPLTGRITPILSPYLSGDSFYVIAVNPRKPVLHRGLRENGVTITPAEDHDLGTDKYFFRGHIDYAVDNAWRTSIVKVNQ